ncbi:hypothetical protein K458DRAFT_448566 [Lentithecium fluviatile CBS 122367]|uniref:Uncharacterized protein n=1 Tax=Lentithecium fluviatile CBS 122367 TaxID=1168545 RepID=A0A6G1JN36_9PLEO|nr:hypothetical protein K458DRAFT_448566 [Lentithecium fluviatile CBS 122367]
MTILPTVVCAAVFGFLLFALVFLHKTNKEIVLDDEYDKDLYRGTVFEDVENSSGAGPPEPATDIANFEPGPEYENLPPMPKQVYPPLRSNSPSDWSHTIGSFEFERQRESTDQSGPSSGLSYSTAHSRQSPHTSSTGHAHNNTPVRSHPPLPTQPHYPVSPLSLNERSLPSRPNEDQNSNAPPGRAKGQEDNRMLTTGRNTNRDSIFSDLTGTTNDGRGSPSRLMLGSAYDGSEITANSNRALSEDYTGLGRGF